ncbi:MAG: hypothetical protein LBU26_02515, partial [Synergistaceae bacterium]|nr:hypothetical protein [Synergistaceae bacterium]
MNKMPWHPKKIPYRPSSFSGDHEYYIDCMGDVVTGDDIRFERSVIRGVIRGTAIPGFDLITGKVVSEWYRPLDVKEHRGAH